MATIETVTVQAGDTSTNLPVGTALVRIGFSKLNVSMASLNTDVALGSSKDNLNQVLGSVYLGGLKTDINGSVDIHTPSPSTQGIVFDLDFSVAMQPNHTCPGAMLTVSDRHDHCRLWGWRDCDCRPDG